MDVGIGLDSRPCLVSIIFADLTPLHLVAARAMIVRMRKMNLPRLFNLRVHQRLSKGFRDFCVASIIKVRSKEVYRVWKRIMRIQHPAQFVAKSR